MYPRPTVSATGDADGPVDAGADAALDGASLPGDVDAGPVAEADADAGAPVADGVWAGPPVPHAATRAAARMTPTRRRGRDARGTGTSRGRMDLVVGRPVIGTSVGGSSLADQPALDSDHDEVERHAQQRERDEGGEHERDVEQRSAGDVDQHAEALVRGAPLADDRTDHGEGDADPHAAEDRRQRRGNLDVPHDLPVRGTEAARHLEQPAVDPADPDHRRDRDREE